MESQTHSKGGRPTKYREEFCDQLIEFFEDFVKEPFTKEIIKSHKKFDKDGNVKEEHLEYKHVSKRLPTLFGFSRKVGVAYFTMLRWSEARIGDAPEDGAPDRRPYKYPEFCESYKNAMLFQTEFLTAVGLGGMAPAAAFVFTAKNVLKWKDETYQGFLGKKGNAVNPPGYIVLPAKKSEAEAASELDAQESIESETP